MSETPKGEEQAVTVCQYPIYLASVATGELRSDRFGLLFKSWLPKQGWREFTIPAKTIGGPTAMATMMEKGVPIEESDLFRKYVRDAMNQFYSERTLETQYEQCGWKNDNTAFLVGTRLYSHEKMVEVAASNDVQHRGQYLRAAPRGSLAAWTKAANIFAAATLEMHLYAVLASFAAPLMKFLSADEGGGIVSCVSSDSGRGKTLVIEAVSSVWGELDGLRMLNSDTRVSKGLLFGNLGNLPAVFDEFDTADPDHTLDFVQTFTTGRDKLRATQDGELKQQGAKWQTILVSASNRSLCDSILTANNTAQTYRILELSMEQNDILKTRGDAVRTALKENSGWAGDRYIRYLVAPGVLPQVQAGMNKYRERLESQPWYRSEMRYWARIQTAIALAAVMVERLGLIEFSADRIVRWGENQLKEMASGQESQQQNQSSIQKSLEILASFMLDKRGEILVVPGPWRQGVKLVPYFTPPNRVCARYNVNEQRIFIERWVLHEYVTKTKRFPMREFNRNLSGTGVIAGQPRIVIGAGTDLAGSQVNTVEINLAHPLANAVPRPDEPLGNIVPMRRAGETA